MHVSRFVRYAVALGLLFPLMAFAAPLFPDVGDSHPFTTEIEALAADGIIKGNPDGRYDPERSVNRAEFLKLLYAAVGKTPRATIGCFKDVERGSWYEAIVCDAASVENEFVQGYSDGKFRPGSPVNRAEALKMLFTVFKFDAPAVVRFEGDVSLLADVSAASWYGKYLAAAYGKGILPVTGFTGTRFFPEMELSRGEAAAYIYGALYPKSPTSGDSSSSSASSVSSTASSRSSASSASFVEEDTVKNVAFPFSDAGTFVEKKSISYVFDFKKTSMLSATVTTSGFYPSDVTCRLYLMSKDGFSSEYYLGVQTTNTCSLKSSLRPGTYQLQIQPAVANVPFQIDTKTAVSDGNDGFADALGLTKNLPKTAVLDAGDLYDWYTFSLTGKNMSAITATVELTSSDTLTCIIYTPPMVDQFGFSGPECGKPYDFEPGVVYTLGIGRKGNLSTKMTYTVRLK